MNEIELYRGEGLTRRQRSRLRKQLRQIDNFRQVYLLALEELQDVDLYIVEMVFDTLEEAEDLFFEHSDVLTRETQEQINVLTYEYTKAMYEILRAHGSRILRVLERQGTALDSVDPQLLLRLPESLKY